jgi:3',5'-cyclic AMP phosphodiesterase CpdA
MNSLLTRRGALLKVAAGAGVAFGCGVGCRAASTQAGGRPFRFLVVNDLHHGTPECDPFFAALVRQMKTHAGVELALLLGDLADTGKPEDLAAVCDRFQKLGVPFYPVIGNHDYASPTDRSAYEQVFPGRLNFQFGHRDWQFIGIDTTQGTDYQKTKISSATLNWLDATLPKLDRRKPTVLFTHFPLGEGVPMRPLNAAEVLDRFADVNLRGVFGGHHHGFTGRKLGNAEVVTNRCCSRLRDNHDGTKEEGYWLVTAAEGALARAFIPYAGPGK